MKRGISPKTVSLTFGILVLIFVLGFYAFAWTEPSSAPPAGNVPTPLNVGSTAQTKTGNLTVSNLYWNNGISYLDSDQGGSMELGNSLVAGSAPYIDFHYGTGSSQDYNIRLQNSGNGKFAIMGGSVGIGTTNPAATLDVNGNLKVGAGTIAGNYGTINFPSSDNDNAFLYAYSTQNGAPSNTYDLRLYLQDDQDDSEKFSVWGGSCSNGGCSMGTANAIEQFHVTAAGNGYFRGNLAVGNNLTVGSNLTVAGKLTISTIDPVYNIGGKNYATYVSDYSGGVRTETSGNIKVDKSYTIDFDKLQTGSDLWLFWQTSDKNMNDLVVNLTPGFSGSVWYQKDGNKLIIDSSQSGEVSYQLSAPRVDYQKWSNLLSE